MDLIQRPRRLRGSENLRKMVRETRMDKSSLIYPLFVKEGTGIKANNKSAFYVLLRSLPKLASIHSKKCFLLMMILLPTRILGKSYLFPLST